MKAILTAAILLLASCGDSGGGDRSPPPPPPDPVQAGSMVFDGLRIEFLGARHIFDPANNRSIVELWDSDPVDWKAFLQWTGDRDPGFIDTTVDGDLEVWVFDPTMDIWMSIYPMSNISWAQVDEWSAGPGWTLGSFWGTMQSQSFGTQVAIEGGSFTAERRQ